MRIPTLGENPSPLEIRNWLEEMETKGLLFHLDDNPRHVYKDGERIRTFTDEEADVLEEYVGRIRDTVPDPFALYPNTEPELCEEYFPCPACAEKVRIVGHHLDTENNEVVVELACNGDTCRWNPIIRLHPGVIYQYGAAT